MCKKRWSDYSTGAYGIQGSMNKYEMRHQITPGKLYNTRNYYDNAGYCVVETGDYPESGSFVVMIDHFYSDQEMRKIKLKKIYEYRR